MVPLKSLLLIVSLLAPVLLAAAQLDEGLFVYALSTAEGVVFCRDNGNMGINGPATPVFPNAAVQWQSEDGNVISSTTTNSAGEFSMLWGPQKAKIFPLPSLLNNSKIVVKTPLSTCNSSLTASGTLVSDLKVGNSISVQGLLVVLNITSFTPSGFRFLLTRSF